MGTKVAAPPPRDYYAETRDTLKAQLELAPERYAGELKYAPLYQQLQMDLMKQAAPGMMEMYNLYAPQLGQVESQVRSQSRSSDIADISRLGPEAMAAARRANPMQASIVDSMLQQANSGMMAGSALTPDQQRMVQQQTRAGLQARGMNGQASGAMLEALNSAYAGSGVQQQRAQYATGAMGASQALYGDVFQQVLGRPSQSFGMTGGFAGASKSFNPGQLFNPESQYAGDIYNQNYQGQLAANTASAANSAALTGGIIGGVGKIAGGILSAPAGSIAGKMFGF